MLKSRLKLYYIYFPVFENRVGTLYLAGLTYSLTLFYFADVRAMAKTIALQIVPCLIALNILCVRASGYSGGTCAQQDSECKDEGSKWVRSKYR